MTRRSPSFPFMSGPVADRPFFYSCLLAILLAGGLFCPPRCAAEESRQALVTRVSIEGNKLVETETIKARLRTVEGAAFDPETVSEDIRAVYNLGYFDDVQVSTAAFEGGLAVTFSLREKPLIQRIEFRGHKEFSDEDLRAKVDLKTNAVVNEYDIKLNVERLITFLHEKGYYLGKVDYRLENISANELSLVFIVSEGERLWVREIDIRGNESVGDEEIKDVMKTKEKGYFSFMTHSGTLISLQLEQDVLLIMSHLYNNGYLKARVEDPKIEVDEANKEIKIVINVHEGLCYSVGKLSAPGDEYHKPEEILAVVQTREGDVFRRDTFARDLNAVTQLYTEIGFAFCRVDSRTEMDDARRIINLDLTIDKGPKVTVGRITIVGNKLTRDNVIRREVVLREGEYFSSKKLARSRQRIMNLGFFDKVDITTEPRGSDVIDLSIMVTERLTGALSFGVGYSSEEKMAGVFKITEDNFFGWGHRVQGTVDYSTKRQEYYIYYSNPAVWDSAYSLGMKVYHQTYDYSKYDRLAIGGAVTAGRGLGEYIRAYLTYKNEDVEVKNVAADASNLIQSQEGKYNTRSLKLTLSRDSKDNFFNPTSGSTISLRGEYAGGFLAGDNYFTKYEIEGVFYFPLFWHLVYSIHGETGWVKGFDDHEVPIDERFFMGGINSVRGFKSRSIGPKDDNGDPVGGYSRLLINNEIIFPLVEEQRLMGVIFYDAGQVWDKDDIMKISDLRDSAGCGIRWFSPIGPFRIEWGWNLHPKEGEDKSDWQFSIGTAF